MWRNLKDLVLLIPNELIRHIASIWTEPLSTGSFEHVKIMDSLLWIFRNNGLHIYNMSTKEDIKYLKYRRPIRGNKRWFIKSKRRYVQIGDSCKYALWWRIPKSWRYFYEKVRSNQPLRHNPSGIPRIWTEIFVSSSHSRGSHFDNLNQSWKLNM